jgi:hypothetical protein
MLKGGFLYGRYPYTPLFPYSVSPALLYPCFEKRARRNETGEEKGFMGYGA